MSVSSDEQELTTMNTGINGVSNINGQTQGEYFGKNDGCGNGGICGVLRWFYSPITCNIGYSLCCMIYCGIYKFPFMIFAIYFDAFTVAFSIGAVFFACIGVVLLWFSLETILCYSRLDLWINYHLVETNKCSQIRQKLKVSVYTKHLPLCSCDGFCGVMADRAKHLFLSCNMWTIVIYHVIIHPFIACLCWASFILVIVVGGLISIPMWLSYVPKHQIFSHYGKYNTWTVHISIAVASLFILLPLAVRINNMCAKVGKRASYYFYTYYYNDNMNFEDQRSLVNNYSQSVVVESDLIDV